MKNCHLIALLLFVLITVLAQRGFLYGQTPQYVFTGGTTVGNVSPFGTTGNTQKQWLYTPAQFPGAPAGYITTIYFKTSATPVTSTYTSLLVKMGQTSLTSFVPGPFITLGIDTAMYASSHTVNIISGNWLPITLQSPFYYDGISNFIVDVSQAGYTSGITIQQQTITGRSLFAPKGASSASVQDRLCEFGFDLLLAGDAGITGFPSMKDTICSGIQAFTVTLKNFDTSPLSFVNINWSVNGIIQPSFNWNGTLSYNDSIDVVIGSFNFLPSMSYDITSYTDFPNGTTDSNPVNDTLRVGVSNVVAGPSTTVSHNNIVFCEGDSVRVSVSSYTGNSFQWYFNEQLISGATDSVFYLTQTGKYHVVVSDGICSSISDTIHTQTMISPLATITSYTPTTFCHGDSVWLFANTGTGLTYEWRRDGISITGATASTYLAKENGIYTVTTTNVGNCSTTSDTLGVNVKPVHPIDLGPDLVVCEDITVVLDAGAGADTYLWSNGLTTRTISLDTTIAGLGAKTYSVTATLNGCESRDDVVIAFINCTGVEQIESDQISIYPNPAVDRVEIRLPKNVTGDIYVSIFSIDGRLLDSRLIKNESKINKFSLNLEHLTRGVYLMKLEGESFSIKSKLIIN